MPNWCQNTLNISGDEQELKSFLEQAKGEMIEYGKKVVSAISMGKMFPTPSELMDIEDRETNWYSWRLNNW